jgi:hypothetical protein
MDFSTKDSDPNMGANPELSNSLVQMRIEYILDDGSIRCARCATATTKPFRFRKRASGIKLDFVALDGALSVSHPYCFDCCDLVARKQLIQNKSFTNRLGPREVRDMIVTFLQRYAYNVFESLLLADHYSFCRCCLKATALVKAPGEACDACRDLPRCGICGRSRGKMVLYPEYPICNWCRQNFNKTFSAEALPQAILSPRAELRTRAGASSATS